jgi:hypothetical protein
MDASANYNGLKTQRRNPMANPGFSLFRLATAPARFALRQTITNIETLQSLRRDAPAWRPILEQAAEETLENLVRVVATTENSLPDNIEDLTPSERKAALAEALARSEKLLLAAFGELYRSWRLASANNHALIENPPQSAFPKQARNP